VYFVVTAVCKHHFHCICLFIIRALNTWIFIEFLPELKIEVAEMKFIGIIQRCVKSDKIKILYIHNKQYMYLVKGIVDSYVEK
jgi:hypothetical protein